MRWIVLAVVLLGPGCAHRLATAPVCSDEHVHASQTGATSWYDSLLLDAREPAQVAEGGYRALVWPGLSANAYIVRVEPSGRGWTVRAVVLHSVDARWRIAVERQHEVLSREFSPEAIQLDDFGFWTNSSREFMLDPDMYALEEPRGSCRRLSIVSPTENDMERMRVEAVQRTVMRLIRVGGIADRQLVEQLQ